MGAIASLEFAHGNTTCVKKPHLHASIEYAKNPAETQSTGELGLTSKIYISLETYECLQQMDPSPPGEPRGGKPLSLSGEVGGGGSICCDRNAGVTSDIGHTGKKWNLAPGVFSVENDIAASPDVNVGPNTASGGKARKRACGRTQA